MSSVIAYRPCPEHLIRCILFISHELARVLSNVCGEAVPPACGSQECSFENAVFAIRSFGEREDSNHGCQPNFKCGDVEVFWGKRLGRSAVVNKEVSPKEIQEIFFQCLKSIWDMEDASREL